MIKVELAFEKPPPNEIQNLQEKKCSSLLRQFNADLVHIAYFIFLKNLYFKTSTSRIFFYLEFKEKVQIY